MPNSLETLIVERADGVVTVTLNRPARKNAANGTMWTELLATFDDVATDRNDRVMILTGSGDAFCSGADLGDASNVAGRVGDPYLLQMRGARGCSAPPTPIPQADHRQGRWNRRRCRNEHGTGLRSGGCVRSGPVLPDLLQAGTVDRLRCVVAAPSVDRSPSGQGAGLLRRYHRRPTGG